jgi:vitamin K-dependent gamma-carboxylase-like protein
MTRLWRAWVELWDRREDAAALAAARIGIGLVLLYDFVTIARLDLVEGLWARPPAGFAAEYDGWAASWLGTGPDAAFALWLAVIIALAAMTVGLATRVACVVFVLVSAQLGHIAPDGERGIDLMLRVIVGILAFSRCNARWSIDAWVWRRLGRPIPQVVPSWPRLLLLAQVVWVYFSGGQNKGGREWFPPGFGALANTLSDPSYARFGPDWVDTALPLTRVATAVTITFELTAPIYLLLYYFAATPERGGRVRAWCNRVRARWIWMSIGASFHVGIAIVLRLGIFPWGMLALYPVLLLPEEVARIVARIGRITTRRGRGADATAAREQAAARRPRSRGARGCRGSGRARRSAARRAG